jgi:SAM-dependent methyltransferase
MARPHHSSTTRRLEIESSQRRRKLDLRGRSCASWTDGRRLCDALMLPQAQLLFQRDVPDDALLLELYGQWLGKNDELAPHQPPMTLEYHANMAQEVMQLVALMRSRVSDNRRLKFLDFGMGWGHWAQTARALGADVYGLEYSPEKIAHAKSLGFKILDGNDLALHKFDFINTEQVVEHLADPRATVSKLTACLAPRGVLKLSVPDGRQIKATMNNWTWKDSYPRRSEVMEIHPLEHLNCFTSKSLTSMAVACDLKRVELPLSIAYAYSTAWTGIGPSIRKVLQPIKRFVFKRGCYALFSRDR